MPKSPDAFRTISEVADWLGIQAHVLRFWESKFTQVKPIKRAGGRRYYRPADMKLLGGIRKLLHEDGLTIKGVQKILREEGMSHVAAMSVPLDDESGEIQTQVKPTPAPRKVAEPEEAVVLPFEAPKEQVRTSEPDVVEETKPEEADDATPADVADDALTQSDADEAVVPEAAVDTRQQTAEPTVKAEVEAPAAAEEPAAPEATSKTVTADTIDTDVPEEAAKTNDIPAKEDASVSAYAPSGAPEVSAPDHGDDGSVVADEPRSEEAPTPDMAADEPLAADQAERDAAESGQVGDEPTKETTGESGAPLPTFLRKPSAEQPSVKAGAEASADKAAPEEKTQKPEPVDPVAETPAQQEPPRPKARDIGMPSVTPEAEIHAEVTTLTSLCRTRRLDMATAQQVQPLLAQLSALRDRMAARPGGAQPKS